MNKFKNYEEQELLTAKDIMKICGVGQNKAYEILSELPIVRIGGKKCRRADLNAYIEACKIS